MIKKKIIIAGANGYLGKVLIERFAKEGHEVHTLTRKPMNLGQGIHNWVWDGEHVGAWVIAFEKADALINLAGRSVDCRYTAKNKQQIRESRKKSTLTLGAACIMADRPPKLWINSSSATIYAHNQELPAYGEDGKIGDGFSVEVCQEWESTFFEIPLPETRKVALRLAMVLGNQGGVLPTLVNFAKKGIGGTMGHGQQYMSWIHEEDFVRAIEYIMDKPVQGEINLSAPQPERNQRFMKMINRFLGQKIAINHPAWLLEIGAFILRTETELILKSRKVYPKKLLEHGFTFKYPDPQHALKHLLT